MTTENNKIIAEFMGSNYINDPYTDKEGIKYDFYYWTKPSCNYPKSIGIGELSTAWQIGNFHFHDSWDWLMEVVEKIEAIEVNNIKYIDFHIMPDAVIVTNQEDEENPLILINKSEGKGNIEKEFIMFETKIQAVYNACVEFIKYYNEQNRK